MQLAYILLDDTWIIRWNFGDGLSSRTKNRGHPQRTDNSEFGDRQNKDLIEKIFIALKEVAEQQGVFGAEYGWEE